MIPPVHGLVPDKLDTPAVAGEAPERSLLEAMGFVSVPPGRFLRTPLLRLKDDDIVNSTTTKWMDAMKRF